MMNVVPLAAVLQTNSRINGLSRQARLKDTNKDDCKNQANGETQLINEINAHMF